MSKPNKTLIKNNLEAWATAKGALATLEAQRSAAIKPILEKADKSVIKASAEFAEPIATAKARVAELEAAITTEFQKGFDAGRNDYDKKKFECDLALVEVNTTETREISSEAWVKEVPEADKTKPGFWGTVKILIGNAEKFRSDLVEKLATKKRNHTISVKLK